MSTSPAFLLLAPSDNSDLGDLLGFSLAGGGPDFEISLWFLLLAWAVEIVSCYSLSALVCGAWAPLWRGLSPLADSSLSLESGLESLFQGPHYSTTHTHSITEMFFWDDWKVKQRQWGHLIILFSKIHKTQTHLNRQGIAVLWTRAGFPQAFPLICCLLSQAGFTLFCINALSAWCNRPSDSYSPNLPVKP